MASLESFLGEVFRQDEEMQIALRSAAGLTGDDEKIFFFEKCLARAVNAIEKVERMLSDEIRKSRTNIASAYFTQNEFILSVVEADIMWKQELMDSVPLPATEDQMRALATLVKAKPFLGKLSVC